LPGTAVMPVRWEIVAGLVIVVLLAGVLAPLLPALSTCGGAPWLGWTGCFVWPLLVSSLGLRGIYRDRRLPAR